jgi:rubredoxin
MARYFCTICMYVYDEAVQGIPFDDLDEAWVCPKCGASKWVFEAAPSEPPADPDQTRNVT